MWINKSNYTLNVDNKLSEMKRKKYIIERVWKTTIWI